MKAINLLVLDGKHGRILGFSADGATVITVLDNCGGTPDGIAVDAARRHIYWTNMGEHYDRNDGFIERIDFDGTNRTMIVPKGGTFTPKQLKLDLLNSRIYWCDREGMRVMCANLDGTHVTTLVETGWGDIDRQDETRHCVGIALDVENGFMYWTQKGPPNGERGRIFRAGLTLPPATEPNQRKDIEVLWNNLPEPIDLELNHHTGQLYWTDRGDPPRGNTLNRASVREQPVAAPEVLSTGLREAIGLTLDVEHDRAFFVDLGGYLYCTRLDGSQRQVLYAGDGQFTGMTYVEDFSV